MKIQQSSSQSGNVLIYVLIAIALFAALSFTLGRQTDSSEAGSLSSEKAELVATQLISYASQAKSAVDQMEFQAIRMTNLNFILPTESGFNSGTNIYKVYHPDGGGLNPGTMPENAKASGISNPDAGWYMGRFNNVEWTPLGSSAGAGNYEDVILTAYGISQTICENINKKITGDTTIPTSQEALKDILVDHQRHSGTSNTDITTETGSPPVCAECHNRASLCIQEGGIFAFYTVIADL